MLRSNTPTIRIFFSMTPLFNIREAAAMKSQWRSRWPVMTMH
jgi:hypothetical protein